MAMRQNSNSPQPHIAMPTNDSFIASFAAVLSQLVAFTPTTHENKNKITRFHGVIAPSISIEEYLNRIAKYFRCSNECFVLSLVYIDRIVKLHDGFAVSILNIHRLLITSIMLAAKYFDDVYFSNSFYARVGGVETDEINAMEAHFLSLINYKLYVSAEEYDQYRHNVEDAVNPRAHSHINSHPSFGSHINLEHKDHTKNTQQCSTWSSQPHQKHSSGVFHKNGMNRSNHEFYPSHHSRNNSRSKTSKRDDTVISSSFYERNSMPIKTTTEHQARHLTSCPFDVNQRNMQFNDSLSIADNSDKIRNDSHNRNGVLYR